MTWTSLFYGRLEQRCPDIQGCKITGFDDGVLTIVWDKPTQPAAFGYYAMLLRFGRYHLTEPFEQAADLRVKAVEQQCLPVLMPDGWDTRGGTRRWMEAKNVTGVWWNHQWVLLVPAPYPLSGIMR